MVFKIGLPQNFMNVGHKWIAVGRGGIEPRAGGAESEAGGLVQHWPVKIIKKSDTKLL